jgi:hypothetical protein
MLFMLLFCRLPLYTTGGIAVVEVEAQDVIVHYRLPQHQQHVVAVALAHMEEAEAEVQELVLLVTDHQVIVVMTMIILLLHLQHHLVNQQQRGQVQVQRHQKLQVEPMDIQVYKFGLCSIMQASLNSDLEHNNMLHSVNYHVTIHDTKRERDLIRYVTSLYFTLYSRERQHSTSHHRKYLDVNVQADTIQLEMFCMILYISVSHRVQSAKQSS